MRWNNKEALNLFTSYTSCLAKTTSKNAKCIEATANFIETFEIPDDLSDTIRLKFRRLLDTKPGNKCTSAELKTWEDDIFYDFVHCGKTEKRKGRPPVVLGDSPCLKKTRSILSEAISNIEQFATDQNVSKEKALQMVVDECCRTWHLSSSNALSTKATIPVVEATALIYNVNISTNQYQMIRTLCLPHNVVFPIRNTIDNSKSAFHPPITSCQIKSSVDIKMLLDETACALIELSNKDVISGGKYELVGKFGADGSGSHKIRQQVIDTSLLMAETPHLDPTKSNSFLLSCYCPLELRCNDEVLWTNPVPNSTAYARPVSLTRTTEDRDVLSIELEPSFAVIRKDYSADIVVGSENVNITCKTECSMIDGKMASLLQGDSGAFCHLCHVTRADANDTVLISQGFQITKDYKSCLDAWKKLDSGEISYSSSERQGQCHEPIVKAE